MANPFPKQIVAPHTAQQYAKLVTLARERGKTREQIVQELVDEA